MNRFRTTEELLKWINEQERFYLYGAGNVCRKVVQVLKEMGGLDKAQAILVTESGKNEGAFECIEVLEFSPDSYVRKTPVLIASTAYGDVIAENLHNHGIYEYCVLDKLIERDLDTTLKQLRALGTEKEIPKYKAQIVEEVKKGSKVTPEDDIMLLSPPYWDVYSPFSAVPCLTAYLKQHNYKVKQLDLGIHCIHHVIKRFGREEKEYLKSTKYYAQLSKYEKNPYKSHEEYVNSLYFFDGEDLDIKKIKQEYKQMNATHKRVVDAMYRHIYDRDSSFVDFDRCGDIHKEIRNNNQVSLWETLNEKEILSALRSLPKMVGLSITSTCQFVSGCIIAELIRECRPDVKIVFGGSCADLFLKSEYKSKQDIRKYFDYILVGEGETALLQLANYVIRGEGHIEDIPNMAFVSEDGQVTYSKQVLENVDMLPAPDYDGLNLDLYLAPEILLPYQTSRGCHYGQCAFCNHDEKYRHNYRTKKMQQVVADLISLSQKYGVKHFQFVDEAIRPDCFKEMVYEMDKHEEFKEMKWIFYSRVSRQYDEEILRIARRNGCEMVMFGVETFNQRLLKFIKKGISAETSKYCLELFHKCGIKTYAWLMSNLPSETLDEAKEDLQELKRVKQHIDAFSVGAFMLEKNTDMYVNPDAYNIISTNERDTRLFDSHNSGNVIDKQAMLSFIDEEYIGYQRATFLSGNRYTLFFE